MATLLGFTAAKLELALVPGTITVAGRMLTGDDDTTMEAFLYQTGIFFVPIVLAKAGYGFTLNTSTILLCLVALSVVLRWGLRYHGNRKCVQLLCSDMHMEQLEKEGDGNDCTALKVALGMDTCTLMEEGATYIHTYRLNTKHALMSA